MTLHPSELRDPQELMTQVSARVPLLGNTAFLVLVADPSTTQTLEAVHRLGTPAQIDHWSQAADELVTAVGGLAIPREPGPPHEVLMSVLVRPGLCVFGANESQWFRAWRYSNHLARAYSGQLILVTEHGWRDSMSEEAGHLPAMAA